MRDVNTEHCKGAVKSMPKTGESKRPIKRINKVKILFDAVLF